MAPALQCQVLLTAESDNNSFNIAELSEEWLAQLVTQDRTVAIKQGYSRTIKDKEILDHLKAEPILLFQNEQK